MRSLSSHIRSPTNISTKSDPEIEKKGTFDSPAIACGEQGDCIIRLERE